MSITELIEQLKAMPEKMEGFNSEGELVVLNTHKLAESLKKSLRNCDVGTVKEQSEMFGKFCYPQKCNECKLYTAELLYECVVRWSQMPYEEGGAE